MEKKAAGIDGQSAYEARIHIDLTVTFFSHDLFFFYYYFQKKIFLLVLFCFFLNISSDLELPSRSRPCRGASA